jgi:DNA-binding SARP family transcriptional activator
MTDPATTGRDTAHEAEGPATGDGAEGLRIRCLGPLEALRGGQPVKLGGPRQRLVLAHLLIRPNETVAVERLIRDVWDDDAPQTARGSVQTYISHLRRALGADRIASNGQGYTVRVRSEEFDRSQFDALVAEGQRLRTTEPDRAATILRDALDLWRGPPFADLADAASLQPEITRLTEARMAVLEARIGADLDAGRDLELVGELEALVAANPLRERLWGQLMLALYRAGRQGDALAAFERVRGLLSDELGVDPSDELRALHRQVLQQESAWTPTTRGWPGAHDATVSTAMCG